jgi:hypothetical protein
VPEREVVEMGMMMPVLPEWKGLFLEGMPHMSVKKP